MSETEPPISPRCSICKQPIPPEFDGKWRHGHNAEPINDGRCCRDCNDEVVIPTRLIEIYRATRK
jgi:hypothetical protein